MKYSGDRCKGVARRSREKRRVGGRRMSRLNWKKEGRKETRRRSRVSEETSCDRKSGGGYSIHHFRATDEEEDIHVLVINITMYSMIEMKQEERRSCGVQSSHTHHGGVA